MINVNYFCRRTTSIFAGPGQGDAHAGDHGVRWVMV
jgi:hypothetical protein